MARSDLKSDNNKSSFTIILREEGVSDRTILPDIDMTIASYDIYGDGPGSSAFQELGWAGSVFETGILTAGTWIISVNAKNASGTVIADGVVSASLVSGGQTPVTVTVTPVDGQGSCVVTINWDEGDISSPAFTAYAADADDNIIALDAFTYSVTSAVSTTALDKGYYRLFISVNDGSVNLYEGFIDSFRIVYNEETFADIDLSSTGGGDGIVIIIDPIMDDPIVITFSGQRPVLEQGETMTVTATTDPSPVDSYQWYLDGQPISGAVTDTVTAGSGLQIKDNYRLTLVVGKGTVLSSESVYFSVVAVSTPPDPDTVDDFNDGNDTNNWGGIMGTMPDATISHDYDSSEKHGATGSSLRLDYDVDAMNSWNGFWMKLAPQNNSADTPVNLSSYKHLSMWVKGNSGLEHMKIQLTNASSNALRKSAFVYIHDYLDGGVTTSWREVKIPLKAFVNLDSLANVTEISLVFENAYAQSSGFDTIGTIYIDDIKFSTQSLGYLRIDHFGDNWGLNALGGNSGDMGGEGGSHYSEYSVSEYHNYSRSLRSTYDLSFGGWAGYWFIFGNGGTVVPVDVSEFNMLSMWVKVADAANKPYRIKIEIVDNVREYVQYIPSTAGTPAFDGTWTKYQIDLDYLASIGFNKTSVRQLNIVYGLNDVGVYKNATVYFDEIQFENAAVHSGSVEISGANAKEKTAHWYHEVRTITVYHGQHPSPWPEFHDTYSYESAYRIMRDTWPWEHSSSTLNILEDRYLVEFDLTQWYGLGLSSSNITSIELIVNASGSESASYSFSISDMLDLEDGLFSDAQSDFTVSSSTIQEYNLTLDTGITQISSSVTGQAVSDINASKNWTGVIIKSVAAELPVLNFSNPVLRINYNY